MIPNKAYALARSVGWKPKDEEIDAWQVDALDPTFFQALGKVLGWGNNAKKIELVELNREKLAFIHAHKFFELVLTGGDLEQYWRDLLEQH